MVITAVIVVIILSGLWFYSLVTWDPFELNQGKTSYQLLQEENQVLRSQNLELIKERGQQSFYR